MNTPLRRSGNFLLGLDFGLWLHFDGISFCRSEIPIIQRVLWGLIGSDGDVTWRHSWPLCPLRWWYTMRGIGLATACWKVYCALSVMRDRSIHCHRASVHTDNEKWCHYVTKRGAPAILGCDNMKITAFCYWHYDEIDRPTGLHAILVHIQAQSHKGKVFCDFSLCM